MSKIKQERRAAFLRLASEFGRMPEIDGWRMVRGVMAWKWVYGDGEDGEGDIVWATPFWDTTDCIAVQIMDSVDKRGRGGWAVVENADVPFTLTGDLDADIKAYCDAVRPFLARAVKPQPSNTLITHGRINSGTVCHVDYASLEVLKILASQTVDTEAMKTLAPGEVDTFNRFVREALEALHVASTVLSLARCRYESQGK